MADLQTEQVQGLDQACIIQFSASYWRARKKISKEKLERLVRNNPAAAKWLTGSKSIVDPVEIKKIGKVVGKTTTYLNPGSPGSPVLKHPIAGLKIIPFTLIERTDEYLKEIKAEFEQAVEAFLDNLAQFKVAARADLELDGLYSEMDYPLDLESKYSMEWRFLSMSTPDSLEMVAPDIYQREIDKLNETMEQVRLESIQALRETFSQMVGHICERFSNNLKKGEKKKVFKNSTVNNFYEFFEQFKQRNIFNDEALDELVEKAQAVLRGKDPDEIRENGSVKALIRKNMLPLEKQLKELTSKPRRKLDID